MPIKELSLDEQIKLIKKLDEEEKEYDKNAALFSGDTYTLKNKYGINTDLDPLTSIQNTFTQRPTVKAIEKLNHNLVKIKPENFLKQFIEEIKPELKIKEEPQSPKKEIIDPNPDNEEEDFGIDEAIIKKNNFPLISEIDQDDYEGIIQKISIYNRQKMGTKLASLSRNGLKNSDEYNQIKSEIEELKKYRTILEKKLEEFSGYGLTKPIPKNLIKFGRYYARKKDLDSNTLCIRKKNNSLVFNMKITDGVKHLLFKNYDPKKYKFTDEDLETYNKICDKTGYSPKKHSKLNNIINGTSLFLSINDAKSRLINCLGEIRAGNNNKIIKNDIVSIADLLLKHKNISDEEYKNLHNYINF